MSIEVPLSELPDAVAARSAAAYLVTIRGTRPHVVSVTPRLDAGAIVVGAGRRTALNVAESPEVTLLWPVDEADPKHSLLVDGAATVTTDGEEIVITPTSAILHRARPTR